MASVCRYLNSQQSEVHRGFAVDWPVAVHEKKNTLWTRMISQKEPNSTDSRLMSLEFSDWVPLLLINVSLEPEPGEKLEAG